MRNTSRKPQRCFATDPDAKRFQIHQWKAEADGKIADDTPSP
jgi:hypothetical protein